jgi:hypothetical protein
MCLFAIGIEHPLDMTVQRLHDPDPRQHSVTAARLHSISASIAVRNSGKSDTFFGRLVM